MSSAGRDLIDELRRRVRRGGSSARHTPRIVLWQAAVIDGLLTRWALLEDDERSRAKSEIPADAAI